MLPSVDMACVSSPVTGRLAELQDSQISLKWAYYHTEKTLS